MYAYCPEVDRHDVDFAANLLIIYDMTWVDIVIIVITLGLVIHGIVFGLIRGLFDIVGIIAGYLLAVHYSSTLNMPSVLAFILVFVVVVVVISILGRIISKLVHVTPIGLIDRLLGGVLGLAKAFVVSFVFVLVVLLIHKSNIAIMESEIASWVLKGGLTASHIMPKKWYDWIDKLVKTRETAENNAFDYISYRLRQ
jgi:membrane protein required for colicin V production